MASELKLRRGTTAEHATFTGAIGEVTVDTTSKSIVVHDGATAGGFPHLKADDLSASSGASMVGANAYQTQDDVNLERISVKTYGAKGDGVTNDTPAFQAAINSGRPFKAGDGTFLLNTPVLVPKNSLTWTEFSGIGKGTVLKLGVGNSTAFSKPATVAGDVVQKIRLTNFVVDSSLSGVAADGAAIFGGRVNGTESCSGLSWNEIHISNVDAINIYTDNTNAKFRQGIHMSALFSVDTEPATYITNIHIRDVNIYGGKSGVFIGAGVTTGDNAPCFMDEVYIDNVYHDTMLDGTTYPSAGMQIGQDAYGGKLRISRVTSRRSGDVGIEVNGWMDAVLSDCNLYEAGTGYWSYNYHQLQDWKNQRVIWKNCVVENTRNNPGWRIGKTKGGHFTLDNCKCSTTQAHDYRMIDFAAGTLESLESLTILNSQIFTNVLAAGATGAGLVSPLSLHVNASYALNIDGLDIVCTGLAPNATQEYSAIIVNATVGTPLVSASIKNMTVTDARTGTILASDAIRIYGTPILNWGIENLIVNSTVPVSAQRNGLYLVNSSIASSAVNIKNSDLSGCTSLYEVRTANSTQRGNIWLNNVKKNLAVDATTAVSNPSVGATPWVWKNEKGYPVRVVVSGGTVSLIESSQDGVTYYGLGFTSGSAILYPNEFIRITHSVTPSFRVMVLHRIVG